MQYRYLLVIFAVVVTLSSCKLLSKLSEPSTELLAKVGRSELYFADVKSIFTPGISADDSLVLLNSVVDTWIKKELKIQSADKSLSGNAEDEIKNMVEEYRKSLVIYHYEQELLNKYIDTIVTTTQIREFYDENTQQFQLYSPIIKGRILRFPINYRQASRLRELMRSSSKDAYLDLVDLAEKNSMNLEEFNNWTEFSTVASFLPPLPKNTDINTFLSSNLVYESNDKQYGYILKVEELRRAGEQRPLEHVTDMIAMMIINNRKKDALKSIEDSLYNNAVKHDKITIHINNNVE